MQKLGPNDSPLDKELDRSSYLHHLGDNPDKDALVRAVSKRRVGDTIKLTIYRNGAALNVPMKLLRPPADLG